MKNEIVKLLVFLIVISVLSSALSVYFYYPPDVDKELPVVCRKPSYIIKAHERRTYFVDKIEYPDHQLTKQEILNYSDSIEKYNQLLKD